MPDHDKITQAALDEALAQVRSGGEIPDWLKPTFEAIQSQYSLEALFRDMLDNMHADFVQTKEEQAKRLFYDPYLMNWYLKRYTSILQLYNITALIDS